MQTLLSTTGDTGPVWKGAGVMPITMNTPNFQVLPWVVAGAPTHCVCGVSWLTGRSELLGEQQLRLRDENKGT